MQFYATKVYIILQYLFPQLNDSWTLDKPNNIFLSNKVKNKQLDPHNTVNIFIFTVGIFFLHSLVTRGQHLHVFIGFLNDTLVKGQTSIEPATNIQCRIGNYYSSTLISGSAVLLAGQALAQRGLSTYQKVGWSKAFKKLVLVLCPGNSSFVLKCFLVQLDNPDHKVVNENGITKC